MARQGEPTEQAETVSSRDGTLHLQITIPPTLSLAKTRRAAL